jgi:hypothetical protein
MLPHREQRFLRFLRLKLQGFGELAYQLSNTSLIDQLICQ